MATANKFKTGGKDEYQLLKEVTAGSQQTSIDLKNISSPFYKICLEGENNSVNRWIIIDNKSN